MDMKSLVPVVVMERIKHRQGWTEHSAVPIKVVESDVKHELLICDGKKIVVPAFFFDSIIQVRDDEILNFCLSLAMLLTKHKQ